MALGLIGQNFYQVVSLKHKLIFLTPPRCSTYSLRDFLDKGNIKMDEPIRSLTTPFYHATLSEIVYAYNINLKDLKNYKIIQVTRNPINRFISSYFYQQKILGIKFDFESFISRVEQLKYLLPENPNEFFLNFYRSEEYKLEQYSVNQHGGLRFYYNQTWWNNLYISPEINYFKLEDISSNSSPLCDLLNISPSINYPSSNTYPQDIKPILNLYKHRIYNLFLEDFIKFNYVK